MRASRDDEKVKASLAALQEAARNNSGNLLALSIEAMRARASVGELSSALEEVFGRYTGKQETVRDIYRQTYGSAPEIDDVENAFSRFYDEAKEAPILYMAKLGQDGHDRGAKVISSAFGDFGMDVRVGTLFQTPEEAAQSAIDMGAHIIGVSSLAAGHKTLLPELMEILKTKGAEDILVICGGIIPQQDYQYLYHAGVAAIFGPGTAIPEAATKTLNAATDNLMRMHNYRSDRISKAAG
jgi:methylmalonyl-CoA mutase